MPPTDSTGRALVEQARQVRADATRAVEESWSRIEECHESTTQAREWPNDGLLSQWLMQAVEDLAASQRAAQEGIATLARIAVGDWDISARSISQVAGVSHHTILRWLADPED